MFTKHPLPWQATQYGGATIIYDANRKQVCQIIRPIKPEDDDTARLALYIIEAVKNRHQSVDFS